MNRRKTRKRHALIRELAERGLRQTEIAKIVGMRPQSVGSVYKRLGISGKWKRGSHGLSDNVIAQIKARSIAGESANEIGDALGITPMTVYNHRNRVRPHRKIPIEDTFQIISRAQYETQRSIAADYGVTQAAISHFVLRETKKLGVNDRRPIQITFK